MKKRIYNTPEVKVCLLVSSDVATVSGGDAGFCGEDEIFSIRDEV